MKRYIKANTLLKDIKITGDYNNVVENLYSIEPDIFEGVSRIETSGSNYSGRYSAYLTFYYGRHKGGHYGIPLDADEDELYEVAEDILHSEHSMRWARHKELSQKDNLASEGKIKLTASALVSRLIKAELGLSSARDNSGRNANWVYYPIDGYEGDAYRKFYDDVFLPFLDEIREQYPDLYINAELSRGWGPRLQVLGPDYAWDKKTHEAVAL